jgi:hypothetical protein
MSVLGDMLTHRFTHLPTRLSIGTMRFKVHHDPQCHTQWLPTLGKLTEDHLYAARNPLPVHYPAQ